MVAAYGSMDIADSIQVSMEIWAATRKALSYSCGCDISSCPGTYPTATCPGFRVGCGLGRELFTLPTHVLFFSQAVSPEC
jgi:hypothetical protein